MLPEETEQHGEVASDERDRTDDAYQGEDTRHQARLVQQEAQQQVVYSRHEALSEEEDAIIKGDKHMAGDQRICSSSGLPQGHDRQNERHADEYGAGFQNSGADEA